MLSSTELRFPRLVALRTIATTLTQFHQGWTFDQDQGGAKTIEAVLTRCNELFRNAPLLDAFAEYASAKQRMDWIWTIGSALC